MAITDRESKGKAILIGLAIVVLVCVLVFFFFGADSILKAILWIVEFLMFLGVLFLLAFLFWYLFLRKGKLDINYVNKMKLIEACTKIKRPFLKDLYVSGDKGHSRGLVGTIAGYCRIQVLYKNYLYNETIDPETGKKIKTPFTKKNERGEDVHQYELEKMEQDVFAVRPKGLIGFFAEPMVIRCSPLDHDELIGDVNLHGFSLIPISEYWFLNSDHLDMRKVDYAILKEAERGIGFLAMTDFHEITQKAMGLDSRHKKNIEGKSLVEIPEVQTNQQQR